MKDFLARAVGWLMAAIVAAVLAASSPALAVYRYLYGPPLWPFPAVAVISAAAVAALLWLLREMFAFTRHKTPIPAEEIESRFPGFVAKPHDFEREGRRWFRVNADGIRVPLHKWQFDPERGEFLAPSGPFWNRRKRVYADGYAARFSAFHKESNESLYGGAAVVAFAIASAAGLVWFSDSFNAWCWYLFSGGPLVWWIGLLLIKGASRSAQVAQIGPEPLTRKTEDFGASSAEAPADHAAADDLSYNATA